MPTFKWSELPAERIDPNSSATAAVVRGEAIGVARLHYPRGTRVDPHAKPHEHVHAILGGRARYRVGDDEKDVGPGEAVLIRANTEHAIAVLDDLEVLDFHDVGGTPAARSDGGPRPVFVTWSAMTSDFITPLYSSGQGPTLTGERIEVAFMTYPAGTEGKEHSHPNEQIQVCLEGKTKGFIAGEEFTLSPGEIVLIPANLKHGVRILADYTTVNCKNIIPGWSVYHARWER